MVDYGLKVVTYFGLLQDLVFGRMEPKQFMAQITLLLDAAQEPVLEVFFMKYLPYLRDCLSTGELSMESLLTPSAGKPYIAEAVNVSSQESTGQTCSIQRQQGPTAQDAQPKVIRRAISRPKKVSRPAISQATEISPAISQDSQPKVIGKVIRPAMSKPGARPLLHPQETVEKGQQIRRGIFIELCFWGGSVTCTPPGRGDVSGAPTLSLLKTWSREPLIRFLFVHHSLFDLLPSPSLHLAWNDKKKSAIRELHSGINMKPELDP